MDRKVQLSEYGRLKMLEITCKNIIYYLFINIDNNTYRIDKNNCHLELHIPDGNYEVVFIATKDRNFAFNDTIKAISLKIKPTLLQPYKDRGFLNHIFGWNNDKYFSIQKVNINVKSKSKIEVTLKKDLKFNYFDNKEIQWNIELSTNGRAHINSEKSFEFLTKNQKSRYYALQSFLLFIKYLLNIVISVGFLIGTIDYNYHPNPKTVEIWQPAKFEIPIYGLLIIIFIVRFVIYLRRIIVILKNDNDVMCIN